MQVLIWYVHRGVTANKPVYAALGGTVEIAGSYGGYGNAVMIRTKIKWKEVLFRIWSSEWI